MSGAAELLSGAYIARRRLTGLPDHAKPHNQDEAYRVRELVAQKWLAHDGGRIIGYKIACTNPSAQKYLNLDAPFYGNLFSALTYDSPAHLPANKFFMR